MATQPTPELSAEVLTYLRRALPHFVAGKSVAEAMAAVLEDDARLVGAAFDRGTSHHFPTPCERGVSKYTGDRKGDLIGSHISCTVYERMQVQS